MKFRYRMLLLAPALALPLMTAMGEGDTERGKAVYKRCAMCHGNSGEGNEAIGKALGVNIPDLGSKEVQEMEDSALKEVILEGKGKMQGVSLSQTELDDVIAFMRSLKKPSTQ